MKCLKRNKQRFYYYLYKDKVPVTDDEGNKTGEYVLTYDRPVECWGNISAGSGDAQIELFGTSITYNKVIVLDNPKCPIDVSTLICIDIQPKSYSANTTPLHDYVVKAVARSLNGVSIAISKVEVNENKG